jgi:glycogen debranching enzyme
MWSDDWEFIDETVPNISAAIKRVVQNIDRL